MTALGDGRGNIIGIAIRGHDVKTGHGLLQGIEWEDWSPYVFEFELAIIRGADSDAGTFDDFAGNGFEPGLPVHPAFQYQKTLGQRIDTEA